MDKEREEEKINEELELVKINYGRNNFRSRNLTWNYSPSTIYICQTQEKANNFINAIDIIKKEKNINLKCTSFINKNLFFTIKSDFGELLVGIKERIFPFLFNENKKSKISLNRCKLIIFDDLF